MMLARDGSPLDIHVHPQRLMIGAGGIGVDACTSYPICQDRSDKTEVDPLAVVGGHTFIFAVACGDPGVDESGEPTQSTIAFRRGSYAVLGERAVLRQQLVA